MPYLLALAAGILGCALILLSLALPWFRVPVDVGWINGIAQTTTVEPAATLALRMICLLAVSLIIGLFIFRKRPGNLAVDLAVLLLVAQLLFPYLVLTWSPREAAAASWLQTQHDNLSWLGGDLYTAAENRDVQFKSQTYVVDPPRQLGVFHLPAWSPQSVQWGRVPEMLEWLGYSNRFCQFVNKGWSISLLGNLLFIFGLCRERDGLNLTRARRVARRTLGIAAITGVAALSPILLAGVFVVHSRSALEQGDYAGALQHLQTAGKILPVIRQDTSYIAQQGLLDKRLQNETPEAALFNANILYKQGFFAPANKLFQDLATGENPTVRREALRAVLRAGIHDLNSGMAGTASEKLEFVLTREPTNLKANYTLELACLRLGEQERLTQLAAEMQAIYKSFNAKNVKPVLGMTWENLAMAEYLAKKPEQSLAQWRKVEGK